MSSYVLTEEDYKNVEKFKEDIGVSGPGRTKSPNEFREAAVKLYDSEKNRPKVQQAMLKTLPNSPMTREYLQANSVSRPGISAKASKLPGAVVDRKNPSNDLSFTAGQVPYNGGKTKSKKSKSKAGGKARSRSRSKSRGKGKSKSKSRSRSRGKSRK